MNKPLVYYCIALFMGCFTSLIFINNEIIGAVLAASFLLIMVFTTNKKFYVFIFIFFIMGITSFYLYFKVDVNNNKAIKIRIIEKNKFYAVGAYESRKINISGNIFSLKEGQIAKVSGEFNKENNYESGSIGNFKISYIEAQEEDLIYKIYAYKKKLYNKFSAYLDEEKAGMVMSLCFGDTTYLNEDKKNDLKKLGVVHAISVSGMHMVLIYKVLEGILGIGLSMFISFLYVIFTGSASATVRSFIMIAILKFSKKLNKNYDGISSLSAAAMAILILKPYYILDIGFMLSFLATLGILLYNKKIRRGLYKLPDWLNKDLSLTLSAQCFSMPYAAFTLKNFSGGFIIGNLFLVPLYSALVIAGNAALAVSFIRPLFKLICKLINLLIMASNGAVYLLLKLSPPITYFTYIESICLIAIYMCFIFAKRGFKKARYFPLCILLMIFLENYYLFPEITYIKLLNGGGIVLRYKSNSIIFTDYKLSDDEKDMLKGKLRINRFKEKSENVEVAFKDIKVLLNKPIGFKDYNLELYDKKNKLIYSDNNSIYVKNMKYGYRYDIIKLNNKKIKKFELPAEEYGFKIINHRAVVLKY